MGIVARSLITQGADGLPIDIECHLSNNLPTIIISGLAGKTVNEAKDRLRGAFANSHLELPRRRITINLAPADIPKIDSGLDLAMAIGVLVASSQVMALDAHTAVIGELSLDGSVRPVRGIIGKLIAGRRYGLRTYYVPAANLAQAQLVPGIKLYPIHDLRELYDHLAGKRPLGPVNTNQGVYEDASPPGYDGPTMRDIVGQEAAKRVLAVAAAGGHNTLFSGPPGTGKSLLAKALPSLLPPLNHEEMLEVTHLHSLVSHDYERLVVARPFRSPHHTTSHIAMVGGGSPVRPGEISLSHRGVLFLDELPEFGRTTLEALRQPLEDRTVSVARLHGSLQFPANFIMIGTTNPCPCGYYGAAKRQCSCLAWQREQYERRLSGPIFDRIDLVANVYEVEYQRLLASRGTTESTPDDTALLASIIMARKYQAERYHSPTTLNSDLTSRQIRETIQLDRPARQLLNDSADAIGLSTRAYLRIIKVARTIADLESATIVSSKHMSEAISYRQRSPALQPV